MAGNTRQTHHLWLRRGERMNARDSCHSMLAEHDATGIPMAWHDTGAHVLTKDTNMYRDGHLLSVPPAPIRLVGHRAIRESQSSAERLGLAVSLGCGSRHWVDVRGLRADGLEQWGTEGLATSLYDWKELCKAFPHLHDDAPMVP